MHETVLSLGVGTPWATRASDQYTHKLRDFLRLENLSKFKAFVKMSAN